MRLEDEFHDILSKAQDGLKMSDQTLLRRAGIDHFQLERLRAGHPDRYPLERVARVLELCPPALIDIAEQSWHPEPHENLPGFAVFQSPCGTGSLVNAYLIWDTPSKNGILFDTGTDPTALLLFAAQRKIRIQMILLTHSHADHISAMRHIIAATDARAFMDKQEAVRGVETFDPGRNFRAGNLIVGTKPTPGHSRAGVTYVISGHPVRLAVVGDCLFAGSMGRAFYSYAELLHSNTEKILTLPEDTILLPGHGPITTVGEEKLHNPFFVDRLAVCAEAA